MNSALLYLVSPTGIPSNRQTSRYDLLSYSIPSHQEETEDRVDFSVDEMLVIPPGFHCGMEFSDDVITSSDVTEPGAGETADNIQVKVAAAS